MRNTTGGVGAAALVLHQQQSMTQSLLMACSTVFHVQKRWETMLLGVISAKTGFTVLKCVLGFPRKLSRRSQSMMAGGSILYALNAGSGERVHVLATHSH